MAKLLTKIWKTTLNTFHETRKEALEFERKSLIVKLVDEVIFEAREADNLKYQKMVAEYRLRGWSASEREMRSYSLPSNFASKLADKLAASELLSPIGDEEPQEAGQS